MSDTSFFVPKGPFYINDLFKELSVQKNQSIITDVKTLDKADKSSITFLNSNDYIDCQSSNWGLAGGFASYYKAIYKNPYGALNGAWDGSTSFVDRTQIPTSCKAHELGYSFLTSWEPPNGRFKLGTCYETGKEPWVDEVSSLN